MNVGLAVGLSFGLTFMSLIIGIPICFGVIVCYKVHRSRRPLQDNVVATTPATGDTVVTPNQTTPTAIPNLYVQSQHPQRPEQALYEDTQFGSQVALPSYDAATGSAISFPTTHGQQTPLVGNINPIPPYFFLSILNTESTLSITTNHSISCSRPGL